MTDLNYRRDQEDHNAAVLERQRERQAARDRNRNAVTGAVNANIPAA